MHRGFTTIVILIGILVLGGLIGGAFYLSGTLKKSPEQVACTMDAKLCPDGSSVGRVGPNCEFTACPLPRSDNQEATEWTTYQIKTLNLQFKLPSSLSAKFGDPKEEKIPGDKGQALIVSFSKNPQDFKMGTTSIDYKQGRGGGFIDRQGYKVEDGKYYAKFVFNSWEEIPSDLVIEYRSNGLDILKIRGSNYPDSGMALFGSLGKGSVGALINTGDLIFPGLAVQAELSDELTDKVFDQIITSFGQL